MTRYCGFDLETPQDVPEYGLQPWRAMTGEATIKSFAVHMSDGELDGAVRMPSKRVLAGLLRHAAAHDITFIGWNVLFDVSWLLALGLEAEVNAVKWIDAMLLLKRLDGWRAPEYGGKGYGLKQAVADTWPHHANYGLAEQDLIAVPQTEEEWVRLLEYNLKDATFTVRLGEQFMAMLSREERKGARIEAEGIVPVAKSYIQGITINTPALDELRQSVLVTRAQATMEFQADPSVVASPKKLGQLLFEEWGYNPVKTTPTGSPATDKESLLKLSIQHPEDIRFKGLMELRKCNTRQTKFIDNVAASTEYHGTNVTRPAPFIAGTYSGRFTYASNQGRGKAKRQTGIALHQWERGKASRNILQAPDGYLLAEFDASGQEMRLMAEASGDETMLTLFEEGIDGHAFMGAAIEGLEWQWIHNEQDNIKAAKEARNMGKFANLSLQYRIGVETIMVRALVQYGLQLAYPKAESIKNTYLRTYRGVPRYWDSAIAKAKHAGYATTFGHRHIALTNLREWEQQQTAINFPIQGTGGDMKALGIACCKLLFDAECQYGWDLHDALFVYIKDDAKALGKVLRIQETLNNLPYKQAWGWQPRIALPWDAKFGKTWGSLKSVEGVK
jgi:DNA polymerase I-like protein with 3'-5' exonuclease and polymerase domains